MLQQLLNIVTFLSHLCGEEDGYRVCRFDGVLSKSPMR